MGKGSAGDEFDALGALYDGEYDSKVDDLAFYQELAGRGGPVLELGCGSGRILAAVARPALAPVVGLDLSAVLLARARRRLARDPVVAGMLRGRAVRLVRGDMRRFDEPAPGGYRLVILAFNAFLHLLESCDQAACLACAARHLAPGGRLVLDVFNPEIKDRLSGVSLMADFTHPETGERVLRFSSALVDLAEQRLRYTSLFDVVGRGGQVRRAVHCFELRYAYRFELERLLEAAGLEVEAVHGGYGGESFTGQEDSMIVLASRPAQKGGRGRRRVTV